MKRRKKRSIKPALIVLVIVIFLMLPFLSVGFSKTFVSRLKVSGDFLNRVTGSATSATSNVNVTVGNTAPRIHNITNYTLQASYAPLEAGVRLFSFTFNASDLDGVGDLNFSRARMELNHTGEPAIRSNYTCSKMLEDTVTNTAMFNCTIGLQYFDVNGGWTINASIADNSSAMATNLSTSLTYTTLSAMVMNQTALRWPSLGIGDTNKTANNDAEVINNTGNVNFTTVQATGYDLQGENVGGFFNVSNFTVSWKTGGDACSGTSCIECDAAGTSLRNATARTVTTANVTRGNNTAGNGQEELYFCIQTIPQITKQAYFSNVSNWLIAVS